MTTLYYFAADLSSILDINSKLIWKEVRKHGIKPQMIVNKYGITEKDVVKLERALGVKVPRKRVERRKSKPKTNSHAKLVRKPAPRKSGNKPSFDAMPMLPKRTVSEAAYFENRQRIKQQQAQRVEPVVLAATSAAPWWGPFGANKQEAK